MRDDDFITQKIVESFWDPEMNSGKKLSAFLPTSLKHGRWRCEKGHSWRSSFRSLYVRPVCPVCHEREGVKAYNLAKNYPSYAKEWHPTRNAPLMPHQVSPDDKQQVWWQCEKEHEWLGSIRHRIQNQIQCRQCLEEERAFKNDIRKRFRKLERLEPIEIYALCGLWASSIKATR